MDNRLPTDQHFDIDLEIGSPDPKDFPKLCDPLTIKVVIDSKVVGEEMSGKKKSKKAISAKKPPKPPRPTKGLSLDAADQKLIKEITELAKMKRASIQRMKAINQKKALRDSSSSSSMGGSLFAMIFTVIFCVMMFFQGMSCRSSGITSHGSPQTAQTNENGLVFIQEQINPSASDSILPHSKSSNLFEKISGSSLARRKLH